MTTSFNSAALRELLITALTDDELSELALYRFRPVDEQFSAGQLRTQHVRLLVEYCERRNVQEFLLAQVQKINLARYAEYEEHTRKTTGTLDSLLNQGLDAGMDALTDRPEPLDEAIHKLRE